MVGKKSVAAIILLNIFALTSWADSPVVLKQDGYFRFLGHYLRKLDQRNGYNNVGWMDMRFRYEPTLEISNSISIHAQIDMLDNVVLGHQPMSGEISVLENAPNDFGLESLSDTGAGGTLSALYGPNQASRNFNVKRVYLEIYSFLGKLKIGRMESNWGMGIFENSGNEYTTSSKGLGGEPFRQEWGDSRFGDTRDGILFATKPLGMDKPLILALRYDKFSEGDIYRPGDDMDRYSVIPLWLDSEREITAGAYISYLNQPSTDTHVAILDPYLKINMPFHRNLGIEAEATIFLGKTGFMKGYEGLLGYTGGNLDVRAYNAVGRIYYHWTPLIFLTEVGYASPEKDGFSDGEINGVPMDPDFHVSLLTFEYVNAYYSGLLAEKLNLPSNLSKLVKTDGAITNALWTRFMVKFMPVNTISSALQVMWAQGTEPLITSYGSGVNVRGGTPAKHYGWELDWNFKFGFGEHLSFDLQMGFLWPGAGLARYQTSDGSQKTSDMIFGLRGGIVAVF